MKTNIGVIFGGRSTEHEISVLSATQAMAAIDTRKYDITPIYITKDGKWYSGEAMLDVTNFRNIPQLLKWSRQVYMRPEYGDYNLYVAKRGIFGRSVLTRLDVVLPVLHGTNCEDGTFEGILDTIGIPYAGCNTLASANGMDKITMKMILAAEGIPVVDYVWFTDKQWFAQRDSLIEKIETNLGYPVIIKPANLGSSVGIGAAHNRDELVERLDQAERYSTRLLVEHKVENMQEINCAVLGDCDDYETSVLEQPITGGEFLDFDEKYKGGHKGAKAKGMAASKKIFPAELPDEETRRIKFLAGETFRVLSCHGVARVDVMIEGDSRKIYVNEINTIPGSLSWYLWDNRGEGISFTALIDRLVALALKRKRELDRKTTSFDTNILSLQGGVKGAKGMKGKLK